MRKKTVTDWLLFQKLYQYFTFNFTYLQDSTMLSFIINLFDTWAQWVHKSIGYAGKHSFRPRHFRLWSLCPFPVFLNVNLLFLSPKGKYHLGHLCVSGIQVCSKVYFIFKKNRGWWWWWWWLFIYLHLPLDGSNSRIMPHEWCFLYLGL